MQKRKENVEKNKNKQEKRKERKCKKQTKVNEEKKKPSKEMNKKRKKMKKRAINKFGDLSQGGPKGSLFNCYYIEVQGRALLLFTWIVPLYPWSVPYNTEC